jgi:hypothetical protein
MLTRGAYTLYVSTAKGRERLACPILKGGPFFFNIPNRKNTSWQCFQFQSQFTPFHLLPTESKAHTGHGHQWSKETLKELSATNSTLILTTPYKVVELAE